MKNQEALLKMENQVGTVDRQLYLNLLRKSLSFQLWKEPAFPVADSSGLTLSSNIAKKIAVFLRRFHIDICLNRSRLKKNLYLWPVLAHTMVSDARLRNIQLACEIVDREEIPGDAAETGVWRGGASIFMRACLDKRRTVFVCDSFEGLPYDPNEPDYEKMDFLKVGLEEVKQNFAKFEQNENVTYIKGWFQDTLHLLPTEQFSIIRLDGDMYESTMVALNALYPKLSLGGFCLIDDYVLEPCRRAVADFRARHQINDPLVDVAGEAVYWRKSSPGVGLKPVDKSAGLLPK